MKKKTIVLFILFGITGLVLTGCSGGSNTAEKEQQLTEENQSRLLKSQPPVKLDWSLERENINKRTELWNESEKVSYIYLMSYGNVVAFYTVKGKVSSVNSQVTNPEQVVDSCTTSCEGDKVLPSPAEDGSYGTNGDGIFFFTTEGVYVETALDYVLVDQPLKINTPISLTREVE